MIKLAPAGVLAVVPIGDFPTEADGLIDDAFIAYQRWGELRLSEDGATNVLLIEHALTGDSDVVEWWKGLVGPGMALDTNRFCVICTNVIGGCKGSVGPASRHPDGDHWGSRFPALSIRDQVDAEKALLDALGIPRLAGVIGGSMGGARTLEWTLMYPELVDSALVIAVSARASAWQIGIQSAQISMIENDLFWHGGDYYDTGYTPHAGLGGARKLAHLTYRGELEVDERFGSDAQPGENPLGTYRDRKQRFAVQSYLDHQARKLMERFDAGSYVILTDSLNRHDISRGRGGLNKSLAASAVPTMVVGVDTDILYPYHQQEHLSRNLGNLLAMGKISSPVGHDAFLAEFRQMDNILRRFIALAEPNLNLPDFPELTGKIEFYI